MSERLAIHGGPAVRPEGPPDGPGIDPEVTASVYAALADGSWGKYDGPNVAALEVELATFLSVPHVATCASGTFAVETALRAAGVGPGDEVILAAYDYEGNFLSVHHLQALPVLVDSVAENWNLDPARIEAALTSRTKAVIVSHLHGGLVDMSRVREVLRGTNVVLIEDAAQAMGASFHGLQAGTHGDIGIVSFGGSKLLSAGRGGALLTSDAVLHQRIRRELRRGVQQHAALSELQAAALRPQLAALPRRHEQRTRTVARLQSLLEEVPGLRMFRNAVDGSPAYYKVGFQFDAEAAGMSRAFFVAAMRAEGFAFDEGFRAAHVGRSPTRFRAVGALTNAEAAHRGCVILHHPILSRDDAEIDQLATAVRKVYANADTPREPEAS